MTIVTHRRRVPWLWIVAMGYPWVTAAFNDRVTNEAFTFTLRRFIEDPVQISFIASINILFNFLVGVTTACLSDRIWTRWGRRKPFLVMGWTGGGLMLALVPLAGGFGALLAAIVCYQFFADFGKPWEPLFNEVVPPPQRGRAAVSQRVWMNLGVLFYATVLIGQFDATYPAVPVFGDALRGEHLLYWTLAAAHFAAALFLAFFVRETKAPPVPGEPAPEYRATAVPGVWWTGSPGGLRNAVLDIAKGVVGNRQARWVYFLYLCPMVTVSATGPNQALFLTEQLGLSKADLGKLNAFTLPALILVFTPLAGWLADRARRMVLFRVGLLGPPLVQFGLFLYLRSSADYQIGFPVLVGVELLTKLLQAWLIVVWGPMVYDYIPSNRMGTYAAGFTITAGVTGFLAVNIGGLWVKQWTALWGTAGRSAYDYSSIIVFALGMGMFATLGTFLFSRATRRGWVRPEGRLELEQPGAMG